MRKLIAAAAILVALSGCQSMYPPGVGPHYEKTLRETAAYGYACMMGKNAYCNAYAAGVTDLCTQRDNCAAVRAAGYYENPQLLIGDAQDRPSSPGLDSEALGRAATAAAAANQPGASFGNVLGAAGGAYATGGSYDAAREYREQRRFWGGERTRCVQVGNATECVTYD